MHNMSVRNKNKVFPFCLLCEKADPRLHHAICLGYTSTRKIMLFGFSIKHAFIDSSANFKVG